MHLIEITKQAKNSLEKAPLHIKVKFTLWVRAVNKAGLMEVRKQPGWHDEPLQKDRFRDKGQRSIRLNRQWRAIYRVKKMVRLNLLKYSR